MPRRRWITLLWGILGLGAAIRIVLGAETFGVQFDLESYRQAAEQLRAAPLDFYAALGGVVDFRWPYPPAYLPWVLSAQEISDSTGLAFHALIGLPAVFADLAIAWLVQDLLGRRGAGQPARLAAVALIAVGPPFVIASGYIPHFDSVAILPAVAALWVWEAGEIEGDRRALAAGALIGLGCAIKTVPILMLLALLPSCRTRREGMTLVGAAAAVPILFLAPFLINTPGAVFGTFDYAGVPGAGGLSLAIQPEMAERWLVQFHDLSRLNETLFENRAVWSLATTALIAGFLFRHRTPATLAAVVVWLGVYAFGTGFFFQYLVWGLPFFLIAGYLWQVALVEVVVAGPMWLFYNGPWDSQGVAPPYAVLMIGLWVGIVVALVVLAKREARESVAAGRARPPLFATGVATLRRWRDRLPLRTPSPAAHFSARARAASVALLAALSLFAVVSLVILLFEARPGEVLTGADGRYAADQLAYLGWIRDASSHLLVDNDYSLAPSSQVYLHPMFALSGGLHALGASVQAAYLIWKPIAVAALFLGFGLYVRRMVTGLGGRLAALALALFFVSPLGPLADWLGFAGAKAEQLQTVVGESFTANSLWGYLPAAISVALIPLFLLGLERVLRPAGDDPGGGGRSYLGWTLAAGALASWIHPWQGEILLVILAGLALWGAPVARRQLLAPAIAVALPLFYYLALSELDPAWELSRAANEGSPVSASILLLGLAPLLLPALVALGEPAGDPQERMLRLWPLAVLVVHFAGSPTVPGHAFEGVALPLAVLAVRGWQRLELPRSLAAAAVIVLTIPGVVWVGDRYRDVVRERVQPHYLSADESAALDYVEGEAPQGGVLATGYLGQAVPAFTGRRVWAGHPSWTPGWPARAAAAEALFDGEMPASAARAFVADSGASILVSDCRDRADLASSLGPQIAETKRFGCATVYLLGS